MTTTLIPAQRLQLDEVAPRQYAAINRFSQSVTLDTTLRELINLRASQLNSCAFCIDMHWKDARARGETEERLYSLSMWRQARCYDERERAALALCEAVTLIADTHVPDDVWAQAQECFESEELAQVVYAIAAINTWNRVASTTRVEPGHYVAGMFGA
jgi:AhpD family alkylhydroperoxidase